MVGAFLTILGICAAVVIGIILGERLGRVTGAWAIAVKIGCMGLLAVIAVGAIKTLFGNLSGGAAVGITAAVLLLPEWLCAASDEKIRRGQGGRLLFVTLIALHHVPEGIAAGISCGVGGSVCMAVCGAVVLHTIPETMVLIPMLGESEFPPWAAYGAAAVSGAMEILGVVLGYCI